MAAAAVVALEAPVSAAAATRSRRRYCARCRLAASSCRPALSSTGSVKEQTRPWAPQTAARACLTAGGVVGACAGLWLSEKRRRVSWRKLLCMGSWAQPGSELSGQTRHGGLVAACTRLRSGPSRALRRLDQVTQSASEPPPSSRGLTWRRSQSVSPAQRGKAFHALLQGLQGPQQSSHAAAAADSAAGTARCPPTPPTPPALGQKEVQSSCFRASSSLRGSMPTWPQT